MIPTSTLMDPPRKNYLILDSNEEILTTNKSGPLLTKIGSLPILLGTKKYHSNISLNGRRKDSIDLLPKTTTTEKVTNTMFPSNLKKNMNMSQIDWDILNSLELLWTDSLN